MYKKHDKWSRSFEIGSVEVSESSQAGTPETCFEENIPASSQEAVTEGRLLSSSVGARPLYTQAGKQKWRHLLHYLPYYKSKYSIAMNLKTLRLSYRLASDQMLQFRGRPSLEKPDVDIAGAGHSKNIFQTGTDYWLYWSYWIMALSPHSPAENTRALVLMLGSSLHLVSIKKLSIIGPHIIRWWNKISSKCYFKSIAVA